MTAQERHLVKILASYGVKGNGGLCFIRMFNDNEKLFLWLVFSDSYEIKNKLNDLGLLNKQNDAIKYANEFNI